MSAIRKFLITGATGKQGGSVIDAPLQQNLVSIRGLTRSPDSPAAKTLLPKGVGVDQGSYDNKKSMVKALRGISSAFLVSTPCSPGGPSQEEIEGKGFVDAAKEAGVEHVVFWSVEGADRSNGVSQFESKFSVEQYLRASGIKYTILRQTAYMENFISPDEKIPKIVIAFESALKGKPIQMVSIRDIGFSLLELLKTQSRTKVELSPSLEKSSPWLKLPRSTASRIGRSQFSKFLRTIRLCSTRSPHIVTKLTLR